MASLLGKEPFQRSFLRTCVTRFMTPWLLEKSSMKGSMELLEAEIKRWHRDKLLATIQSVKPVMKRKAEIKMKKCAASTPNA